MISKLRYPNANLDKFSFVNDSFGGYIKWKVNGTTIMSDDDPSGKLGLQIFQII